MQRKLGPSPQAPAIGIETQTQTLTDSHRLAAPSEDSSRHPQTLFPLPALATATVT